MTARDRQKKREIKRALTAIREKLGEYYMMAFLAKQNHDTEKQKIYEGVIKTLHLTRDKLLDKLEVYNAKRN